MKKIFSFLAIMLIAISSFAVITITPATIDTGYCEHSYSFKCTASGGTAPYVYTVSSGTLPSGLFLNKTTGRIEGIIHIQTATSVAFTIKATDKLGAFGTRAYTMYIRNTVLTGAQLTTIWTGTYPVAYSNVFDTWYTAVTQQNSTSSTNWRVTGGNALTGLTTPFIGSTDSVAFSIRTKNVDRITFKPDGTTGIGTTSPTSLLHINGSGALRYVDGSQGAGKVLTSSSTGVASWQTLTGSWGLGGNTVGSEQQFGTVDNFAIPFITNNIERFRIKADGSVYSNGRANDANSTAYGDGALVSNISGSDNTAYGKTALNANTTGTLNVGIGLNALGLNTTGAQNVGIGVSALLNNLTNSYSTGVGYNALLNSVADGNTAFGHRAMSGTTSGADNVGVGADALFTNTTGLNNTAIGRYAGFGNNGSRNVFLGYAAGFRQTAATDKLLIGSRLYATATEERDSSLIYGEFAADPANQKLKINAATINFKYLPNDSTGLSTGDLYRSTGGAILFKY